MLEHDATNRFGAPDYRAIFNGQSGSAYVNTTLLSNLCPRGGAKETQ
jgi:hypothetical protein